MAWLLSDGRSHEREVGNLVDNELSSSGVTSWDQKLREDDSLWLNPCLDFPDFPALGLLVDLEIVNGFFLGGLSSASLGKWGTSAFEILVELFSVLDFEKTTARPSETVDKELFEEIFGTVPALSVWHSHGSQQV